MAYVDSVRALRVIEYTCKPTASAAATAGRAYPSRLAAGNGQLTQANYTEKLNVGYRWCHLRGIMITIRNLPLD